MYEKLIQAEVHAQEQDEIIRKLQIDNEILVAEHAQKNYSRSNIEKYRSTVSRQARRSPPPEARSVRRN